MAKHLAVVGSLDNFRFIEISDSRITNSHGVSIESVNHSDKKGELQEKFSALGLSDTYEDITLAWSSKKSTIVPNFVLNDSSAEDIYKLCFGDSSEDHSVDFNRVAEIGVVNVYEIPDWVKSFFVLKFPRVVMQHAGSHTIRHAMNENAFYLKATIQAFEDYFLLSMVKHNKLEFYSFFDFQNTEDILYHLSFALQQKEMTSEKGLIEFNTAFDKGEDLFKTLSEMKARVKDLEQLELKYNEALSAKSQLLCV